MVAFGKSVPRSLVRTAILLLSVDLTLIGLFLFWAIAGRYDLRDVWIYGRDEFSMGEGQLTEQWGFVKLALSSAVLAMIAWPQRKTFYWGLSALLAIMFLSDALQLHERLMDMLHPPLSAMLERRHIDVFVKFALAALPLSAMAIGVYAVPASERQPMIHLAIPAIVLGFWASIVDFAHNLFEIQFASGETIGNLFEEGGEGLLITAVLFTALVHFLRMRSRPALQD